MILTSYLYVGVHYMRNNGILSKVAAISIVTLWIKVDVVNPQGAHLGPCSTTVHCFQQRLTTFTVIYSVTILTGATSLDIPLFLM
jgi:hypothetical protein